jgi:hypothetical protein
MLEFKYILDDLEVMQPENFGEFESVIKRDFESHGAYFKYTGDDSLGLTFAGDAVDYIKGKETLTGFTTEIFITIQRRTSPYQAWTTVFYGRALIETIRENGNYLTIDFEENDSLTKLAANFSTKVDFSRTTSLEGNAITPLVAKSTNIPSQRVNKYRDANVGTGDDLVFQDIDSSTSGIDTWYFFSPFLNVTRDTLTTFNDTETNVVGTIFANIPFFYRCNNDGDLTINGSVKMALQVVDASGGLAEITEVTWYMRARLQTSAGVEILTQTLASSSQSPPSPFTFPLATTTYTPTTFTGVNDTNELLIYFEIFADGLVDGMNIFLDWYDVTDINIRLREASFLTTVNTFSVIDVIKYLVEVICEAQTKSDFYDTLGCGNFYVLTSGEQIRSIDRPPQLSLETLLKSLKALHNIGWGFDIAYNEYQFRVEPFEFFYSDAQIIDLGNVVNWEREVYDKLVFNTSEFGYSKFANDENDENSQEDFCTQIGYNLPVPRIQGEYNQTCDLIASKFLIDSSLRQTDTSKRYKNDSDIFIIKTTDFVICETDEDFVSVTGVTDTDTALNIRIAPYYMALNHGKIINSCLFTLADSVEIQNTSRLINRSFQSRFEVAATCTLGDVNKVSRSMTANIQIGQNYNGERFFLPYLHKGQTALSQNSFLSLVERMQSAEGVDNGYITFTNINGEIYNAYLLKAAWNTVTGILKFEALEKI